MHSLNKIFQIEIVPTLNSLLLQVTQLIVHGFDNREGIEEGDVDHSEDQNKLKDFLGSHEKSREGHRDEQLEANFVKED